MNKREQTIAWVVGGGLALYFVGYHMILQGLYLGPRADLDRRILAAQKTSNDLKKLETDAKNANLRWASLQDKGLSDDPARTEQLVRENVFRIAQSSGLQISNWTGAGRGLSKNDFEEYKFKITVNNTRQSNFARFLYLFEQERIDDFAVKAPRGGVDNINADVTIVAIVYKPKKPLGTPMSQTARGAATRSTIASAQSGRIGSGGGAAGGGAGFGIPGAPMTIADPVALDPPLPPGDDMGVRLLRRRELQLEAVKNATETPTGGAQ